MSAMGIRIAAFLAATFLAAAAWAQEQAFTSRSTELKDLGSPSGRTIATLPENTPVKVIARGGGWTKVDANGQQGWVNVFHLRFAATVEKSSSGGGFLGGLSGMLGGNRQAQSTTIATTGIRGLSPEDLKNASPNPEALAKAESYRADKPAAERFARDGKLASASVDTPEGGHR